jgi:bifunctional non-homologous end joining protein LigD
MLARPVDGIMFNEHLMADGARVFDHACRMGLEGIVCKQVDLPYRFGPQWRGSK